MLLSYLMDCIYPLLLLLFSSRCAAAGISGDSLAAEFLAAEWCDGCWCCERNRPKHKPKKHRRAREREKRSGRVCVPALVWRASKAAIMQRQKWGCWRDTRSQRTKMCVLLTPATGGSLGSAHVFPSTFALEALHSSFQACKEDYGESKRKRGRLT